MKLNIVKAIKPYKGIFFPQQIESDESILKIRHGHVDDFVFVYVLAGKQTVEVTFSWIYSIAGFERGNKPVWKQPGISFQAFLTALYQFYRKNKNSGIKHCVSDDSPPQIQMEFKMFFSSQREFERIIKSVVKTYKEIKHLSPTT